MDLTGKNIIVLDLETARSADDCQHCGQPTDGLLQCGPCVPGHDHEPIGWNNKPVLGLSVGCYFDYDYHWGRIFWFDENTLEETIQLLVEHKPLLVSFNGIAFDFALMRGLLRQRQYIADNATELRNATNALCDAFKALCATSYDILAEIWKLDPVNKFGKGLNSLDALSQANNLGAKLSHGAQAPRDWAAGRWANVLNYCQDDVYKTKALFEMVCRGEPIRRSNGVHLTLPIPETGGGRL